MGTSGSKATDKKRNAKKAKYYTSLMKYAHDNVIGDGVTFIGPYGKRAGKGLPTPVYNS